MGKKSRDGGGDIRIGGRRRDGAENVNDYTDGGLDTLFLDVLGVALQQNLVASAVVS